MISIDSICSIRIRVYRAFLLREGEIVVWEGVRDEHVSILVLRRSPSSGVGIASVILDTRFEQMYDSAVRWKGDWAHLSPAITD